MSIIKYKQKVYQVCVDTIKDRNTNNPIFYIDINSDIKKFANRYKIGDLVEFTINGGYKVYISTISLDNDMYKIYTCKRKLVKLPKVNIRDIEEVFS